MKSFMQLLAGMVFGVLGGFDRLMFRGHLRECVGCVPMAYSRKYPKRTATR